MKAVLFEIIDHWVQRKIIFAHPLSLLLFTMVWVTHRRKKKIKSRRRIQYVLMSYVCSVSNIWKLFFSSFILCHLCEVCFRCWLLCLHLAVGLYKHSQLLMKHNDRCHSFRPPTPLHASHFWLRKHLMTTHSPEEDTHGADTCVQSQLCSIF